MNNLAPIILFCYNRPWHVEQTLEALSRNELADQSILYIYCDGPKEGASEEMHQKIAEVRQVVRKHQWCKEVHIVEAEKNKGLANSVISGVTEIINRYNKVIVLEDDLITSSYFLTYMNLSLDFYKDYESVFSIGGYNFPQTKMHIPDDYPYDNYVCLRSCSWGWGTWINRWNKVDWTMDNFMLCKKNGNIMRALNRLGDDFIPMMQMQQDGLIDSWSVRFGYEHFVHHAVAMIPCVSYVRNIGIDGSGTHCGNDAESYYIDLSLSKRSPKLLDVLYEDSRIINTFYSCYSSIKRPLWQKIINFIARKLGKKVPFVIKKKVYA